VARAEPLTTDLSVQALTPDELDAQELEEYAALADFEDLDALPDEWFEWSDTEEEGGHGDAASSHAWTNRNQAGDDVDMIG
jgi:hypothetical protein